MVRDHGGLAQLAHSLARSASLHAAAHSAVDDIERILARGCSNDAYMTTHFARFTDLADWKLSLQSTKSLSINDSSVGTSTLLDQQSQGKTKKEKQKETDNNTKIKIKKKQTENEEQDYVAKAQKPPYVLTSEAMLEQEKPAICNLREMLGAQLEVLAQLQKKVQNMGRNYEFALAFALPQDALHAKVEARVDQTRQKPLQDMVTQLCNSAQNWDKHIIKLINKSQTTDSIPFLLSLPIEELRSRITEIKADKKASSTASSIQSITAQWLKHHMKRFQASFLNEMNIIKTESSALQTESAAVRQSYTEYLVLQTGHVLSAVAAVRIELLTLVSQYDILVEEIKTNMMCTDRLAGEATRLKECVVDAQKLLTIHRAEASRRLNIERLFSAIRGSGPGLDIEIDSPALPTKKKKKKRTANRTRGESESAVDRSKTTNHNKSLEAVQRVSALLEGLDVQSPRNKPQKRSKAKSRRSPTSTNIMNRDIQAAKRVSSLLEARDMAMPLCKIYFILFIE